MRRLVAIGVGIGAVVFASYAGGFWFVIRGEPYQEAKAFIESHPTVHKELGLVRDIGLSLQASFSQTGDKAEARITCPVVGENGQGQVDLFLVLAENEWRVVKADLKVGDRLLALEVSKYRD
jgi:hypothetical protein